MFGCPAVALPITEQIVSTLYETILHIVSELFVFFLNGRHQFINTFYTVLCARWTKYIYSKRLGRTHLVKRWYIRRNSIGKKTKKNRPGCERSIVASISMVLSWGTSLYVHNSALQYSRRSLVHNLHTVSYPFLFITKKPQCYAYGICR